MLSTLDKKLIEQFVGHELGQIGSKPLSHKQKKTFKQRMSDPDFKSHLILSQGVDKAIEQEDILDLRKKLLTAKTQNQIEWNN